MKKPPQKSLGQIAYEIDCRIWGWDNTWKTFWPATIRNYERIARAMQREVLRRARKGTR